MESAAVFVVKADDAAEVLAACGDTRSGFPYPPLPLADRLVAGLIRHPRVMQSTEADQAPRVAAGRHLPRVRAAS